MNKQLATTCFVLFLSIPGIYGQVPLLAGANEEGWILDWNDEFDVDGAPDNNKWAVIHNDERQASKDLTNVKDGSLQLAVKQIDGRWRCGFVMTTPDMGEWHAKSAIGGSKDRKLFAPPANGGSCRLEVRFRGVNAKGGGPMVSGLHHGIWLFSRDVEIPGFDPPIRSMRAEIDMIEHSSPPGGKDWWQSIHIHEFPGTKWGEGGKEKRFGSVTSAISKTSQGEIGNFNSTDWHTIAAVWGPAGVSVFLDGKLIQNRTGVNAIPGKTEDGRTVFGSNKTARYFAFDENFPMGLWMASYVYRVPGGCWGGGIGPAPDETDDYDLLPFTMFYDYVRFYIKHGTQNVGSKE